MTRKTISERVLEVLKTSDKPLSPKEIAFRLGLKRRRYFPEGFFWGKWSFRQAEKEGLIEWDEEAQGWKLTK